MENMKRANHLKNGELFSNSTLNIFDKSRIKIEVPEKISVKSSLMMTDKLLLQNSQCHLCRYQDKLLNRARLRAIANSIVLVFLVAFLIISYVARYSPSSNNICDQNPSPVCEDGKYLKSHFLSSPKQFEVVRCPANLSQEHQQWFDCKVKSIYT